MPTAASTTGTSSASSDARSVAEAPTAQLLVLNAGSSSLKFALFALPGLGREAHGRIERIGSDDARFETEENAEHQRHEFDAADHAAAAGALFDWLAPRSARLAAAGHRVVYAPEGCSGPARVDEALLSALRPLVPRDPEHLPHEIGLIEAVRARWPALPQVACFDTSFHATLPRVAQMFAIPRRYFDAGVRRHGFHGLSYEYLMHALAREAGAAAAKGRVVLAHLGNGASLAAVRGGRSLDTSMGFTPTGGVPMSTRSGDLDPGVLRELAQRDALDVARLDALLTQQSGLLGVSGSSSDMRDLEAREAEDPRAADAVALFCYAVKKCIGAYAAALGGLDALVFSGGIGENDAAVRARICSGLEFLGIELDAARNATKVADAALISRDDSHVEVRVIRTDEEWTIARARAELLGLPLET
jgi:acetate kinase